MSEKKTIDRALSVDNLLKSNFKDLIFAKEWSDFLGEPEMAGSWIIWGGSGCGKTGFALRLAKELCSFSKVLYNSLEEGRSKSFKMAVMRENMQDVARRIVFLDKEPIDELRSRLRKHKSPNIVFIDSVQYTQIKLADYIDLRKEFPKKLFVWVSHEKGKEPDGRLAEKIRYDAAVKIRVEGFRAFSMSRTRNDINVRDFFTIWENESIRYWGFR